MSTTCSYIISNGVKCTDQCAVRTNGSLAKFCIAHIAVEAARFAARNASQLTQPLIAPKVTPTVTAMNSVIVDANVTALNDANVTALNVANLLCIKCNVRSRNGQYKWCRECYDDDLKRADRRCATRDCGGKANVGFRHCEQCYRKGLPPKQVSNVTTVKLPGTAGQQPYTPMKQSAPQKQPTTLQPQVNDGTPDRRDHREPRFPIGNGGNSRKRCAKCNEPSVRKYCNDCYKRQPKCIQPGGCGAVVAVKGTLCRVHSGQKAQKQHTCRTTGCNTPSMDQFRYCSSHKCASMGCASNVIETSRFCEDHRCVSKGCDNAKYSGDYCTGCSNQQNLQNAAVAVADTLHKRINVVETTLANHIVALEAAKVNIASLSATMQARLQNLSEVEQTKVNGALKYLTSSLAIMAHNPSMQEMMIAQLL